MSYAFGSLDELGEGYGFRRIRAALGVTAFGVNAVVVAPGYEGLLHYHDTQDELYFVHRGRARPSAPPGEDQCPNQRARRLDPKCAFSATRAAEGSWKVPVGLGPERKSTSTRPT
jgi:hypothetical protein